MVIEVTHDLLRKIYKMISAKNVSLFEAFVHFDANLNNAISKLEFKLGLQNFNIYLKDNEMNLVWNSFQKARNYKVSFTSFMKSFIEAGALQIVKFDEGLDLLMKKFISVTGKLGNFEEAFRKLDVNNNGVVPSMNSKINVSDFILAFYPMKLKPSLTKSPKSIKIRLEHKILMLLKASLIDNLSDWL